MTTQEHRVALVTGSTSGIGTAIARLLAQEGLTVELHSKSSVSTGVALANELGCASYTQANLTEKEDIRRLIEKVVEKHGLNRHRLARHFSAAHRPLWPKSRLFHSLS